MTSPVTPSDHVKAIVGAATKRAEAIKAATTAARDRLDAEAIRTQAVRNGG